MTTRRQVIGTMAQAVAVLAVSSLGAATVGVTGCIASTECADAIGVLMGKKLESFMSFGDDAIHDDGTMSMTILFDSHGFKAALSELVQRFGAADVMLALGGD